MVLDLITLLVNVIYIIVGIRVIVSTSRAIREIKKGRH
jgi:hypothetical protein